MLTTIKKSISWTYLELLVCLAMAWVCKDPTPDWFWFFLGIAFGLVFETFRIMIRKRNKKKSNQWVGYLFTVIVFLIVFSGFLPILLGVATGLFLPFNIMNIVEQFRFRRVISWEDIQKENR